VLINNADAAHGPGVYVLIDGTVYRINDQGQKQGVPSIEVLGDAEKRKKYDQFGSADFSGFGGGGGQGYAHRAYTWNNQSGAQGGADFNIGDIFGDLFGGGGFSTGRTSKGRRASNPFLILLTCAVNSLVISTVANGKVGNITLISARVDFLPV
jgi:DnaJ-class molecular chaperone